MKLPIYQVDAFTSHVFGGNPAAVCPLTEWITDAEMQQIAMENNLSETAFFVPTDDGFHLRWFTPTTEVDLCGHATLATAHVIFEHLAYPKEIIHFQSLSGLLTVSRSGDEYILNFPAVIMPLVEPPPFLFESLGIRNTECYLSDDYMVVVQDQAVVAAIEPDFKLLNKVECRGVIVTATGDEVDFVSRFFCPQVGIDEDPVTGSAHTKLTPYWAERLGKKELSARQISKRGGELKCRLDGDRVAITGQAQTFLRGEIEF